MTINGPYHINITGPGLVFDLAIDGRADMILAENVVEYVMQRVRADVLTIPDQEQTQTESK